MKRQLASSHITPADGNIFSDLGFSPAEAAALKADADRLIAERLAIKEALMDELAAWIDREQLRQSDAAEILGVTRPRVSDVINRKTLKFTIDALVDMLGRTGRRVRFIVETSPRHGGA